MLGYLAKFSLSKKILDSCSIKIVCVPTKYQKGQNLVICKVLDLSLRVCLIGNPTLPNSENGRLLRNGSTFSSNQTQILQTFQSHPGENKVSS